MEPGLKYKIIGHHHRPHLSLWSRIKMLFGWKPYGDLLKAGDWIKLGKNGNVVRSK